MRGAEEPYALGAGTTFSGSVDTATGVISGGVLSTPPIAFEIDITDPFPTTVAVEVTFAQNGTATGLVDADGNTVIQANITATLDIAVGKPPFIFAPACVAGPIPLTLESDAPYDPATGRVTVTDADFSIPAVPSTGTETCGDIVAPAVSNLLGGAGHSLSMTFAGTIVLPDPPGEPSVTTVAVTPAEVWIGEDLTIDVTVAAGPDAEATEVPSGFVDVLAGDQVIASAVELTGGAATVTTASLPAGSHDLSARYRGDSTYARSTSEPVPVRVAARPALAAEIPEHIRIGGDPVAFDIEVTNTGFGSATHARLDIALRRAVGNGTFTPDRVLLERRDTNGDWHPVPFTANGAVLGGTIGDPTGFALATGSTVTHRLRLTLPQVGTPHATSCGVANATCPGPVTLALDLTDVDTGATLTSSNAQFLMTEATRRALPVLIGTAPLAQPFFPHTIRQGNTLTINRVRTNPVNLAGVVPTGFFEVFIGGRPVAVRVNNDYPDQGYHLRYPTNSVGQYSFNLIVPGDMDPGTHQVTVKYSGDALFQPAQATGTVTVVASAGPAYECSAPSLLQGFVLSANVVVQANLPAWRPSGVPVGLDSLDVRMLFDRGSGHNAMISTAPVGTSVVGEGDLRGVTFSFASTGPDGTSSTGTGTAVMLERTSSMMPATPNPAPVAEVDQVIGFGGETGAVTIEGAPGDTVEVTLDSIQLDSAIAGNAPHLLTCIPVGDPVVIGQVRVAGTTLTADATGPMRTGRPVTLTAQVAPAAGGVVEFRDGITSIGVVPIDAEGGATLTTTNLPVGQRSVTARYLGGIGAPSTTSDPVTVDVLVRYECEAFAQDGNAAVVRLVYMELLRRCPDQAGFDHWVDRLDGGTSPEVFARSIARTPEAVGVVVNDGYQTMLGRNADAAGQGFWVDRMLTGTGRYDQLLADLAASDEFWNLSGSTNEGFVTRVYDRLLHRAPDPAGRDYWTGRLDGGTSRRTLVVTLANLDEPLGVLVVQSYDEILSRTPSSGERTAGITHLRSTGDRSGLYAQLIGRPEFTNRAQGFPNPED